MRIADRTAGELDDETLARMLGEEAAHPPGGARERRRRSGRAEEPPTDCCGRPARTPSTCARRPSEAARRRRADAAADAEAELAMAKQQGREMVEEARAYRERVLGDLARRRDLARQQIEQLVHGRDRLLQAFERARLVAVDVVAELAPLGEPDEYVDLTPTTGPVPVMVPGARPHRCRGIGDDFVPARPSSAPADVALDQRTADGDEAIDPLHSRPGRGRWTKPDEPTSTPSIPADIGTPATWPRGTVAVVGSPGRRRRTDRSPRTAAARGRRRRRRRGHRR